MQELTGKDKIQKICDTIKNETIEPAKQQAKEIIENAHMQKEKILEDAKNEAKKIIAEAKVETDRYKTMVETSLNLACKQTLDDLKQKIMKDFLYENLCASLQEELQKSDVISRLVNAIVEAIDTEGLDTDISVYIPKKVSAKEVTKHLIAKVVERLKGGAILVGDFEGGVKVQLLENEITIDVSDEAVKQMVARYLRKSFQELIFKL